MFEITVPATSANIGPGFDSSGMALTYYLHLQVSKHHQWEFIHRSPFLPKETDYEKHLIYQVAKKVANKHHKALQACKVIVHSDIPLARGLGSSASAVVAGIEMANQLCGLALSIEEKLQLAVEIEGHPDNVAPALLGGLVITATPANKKVEYLRIPDLDLDTVLYIPDVELKTNEARKVLPAVLSHDYAVLGSGISNLMIASLLSKDYGLAGKMMEEDLLHEPFRRKLIPNYETIRQTAQQYGAYGTIISGSGPTMISMVPKGLGETIAKQVHTTLLENEYHYKVVSLPLDHKGLQIKKTT